MKRVIQSPVKTCPTCEKIKPLDPKYWRRDSRSHDGFTRHCKLCTQKAIKDHYRSYTTNDVMDRGKIGVKCILWSPRCGVCPCPSESDLSRCWRLIKIKSDSEGYPIELE